MGSKEDKIMKKVSKKEYDRKWYLKNRERMLLLAKENYRKNRKKYIDRAKKWKENNPEKAKENSRRYHLKYPLKDKKWQIKRTKEVFKIKGGKCELCGFSNAAALEIHHKKKEYKIGKRDWMKKTYDLEKICLICSNCHSIIHYKENKYV